MKYGEWKYSIFSIIALIILTVHDRLTYPEYHLIFILNVLITIILIISTIIEFKKAR